MGTLVLQERARWLTLANVSDREKDDVLDSPIIPEGVWVCPRVDAAALQSEAQGRQGALAVPSAKGSGSSSSSMAERSSRTPGFAVQSAEMHQTSPWPSCFIGTSTLGQQPLDFSRNIDQIRADRYLPVEEEEEGSLTILLL